MDNFTPVPALAGGVLIGLASVWLLAANGRIAGVSGILHGLHLSLGMAAVAGALVGGAALFGIGWGIAGTVPARRSPRFRISARRPSSSWPR